MITKENAKEWLPLVAALAEGKRIEMEHLGKWYEEEVLENVSPLRYRIAPEPRKVPLTAEDIPAVCWVRQRPYTMQYLVCGVCQDHVRTEQYEPYYEDLMQGEWEYSTDRKTWRPCWKEVAE